MLNKDYIVVEGVQTTNGKWSDAMGNGFFIDHSYIITDILDMVKNKVND